MLKWLAVITGIVFLALYSVSYLYGRSLRQAGMMVGSHNLKSAFKQYQEQGYVTNFGSSSYQIWLSSNLVAIGGTQHQCLITVRESMFSGQGVLAITTNQQFIWLDAERPAKVIDANYRVPLFPPRF